MIKIEAVTLEEAYTKAASKLGCSVTSLNIEVVQAPSSGFLGFFKKTAIIVATKGIDLDSSSESNQATKVNRLEESIIESSLKSKKSAKVSKPKEPSKDSIKKTEKPAKTIIEKPIEKTSEITVTKSAKKVSQKIEKKQNKKPVQEVFNDTIMPQSFVSMQDDGFEDIEDDDIDNDMDEESYEDLIQEETKDIKDIVIEVKKDVNGLFEKICFDIDEIIVSVYDDSTILIEFNGPDAALLIGKEGYRYKALSYMLFNWINSKYKIGLRLEIAEFLKNQEESVSRYLESVFENVNRDGRAQTKILDGVLVQIALKELRNTYPDKYVAIRTTRDGLKYIIINEYHNN